MMSMNIGGLLLHSIALPRGRGNIFWREKESFRLLTLAPVFVIALALQYIPTVVVWFRQTRGNELSFGLEQ
jgi:hypothetical protein